MTRLEDETGMDTETRGDLEVDRLTSWFRSYGVTGPWKCLSCNTAIRKARNLKSTHGGRYATLSFCSQDCHDRFFGGIRGKSTAWEKYDEHGILIGYVVPRRGFVSLEQIEQAQLESQGNG